MGRWRQRLGAVSTAKGHQGSPATRRGQGTGVGTLPVTSEGPTSVSDIQTPELQGNRLWLFEPQLRDYFCSLVGSPVY